MFYWRPLGIDLHAIYDNWPPFYPRMKKMLNKNEISISLSKAPDLLGSTANQ